MNMTLPNRKSRSPRRLLAAALLGAAMLPLVGAATAQAIRPTVASATAQGALGPLKHVRAGVLDVAYAELGPADGPVVILLHGWPYDIHSYDEVAPALAAKGYRVLVPYARGYGDTRFLSAKTRRNAEPAALAFAVGTPLVEVEQRLIQETLRHTNGDKTLAAQLLGISARTIYRKLDEQKLDGE